MIGQVAPFRFNQNVKPNFTVSFKQNPTNKALGTVSKAASECGYSPLDKTLQSVVDKPQKFLAQKLGFSQEINSFEGAW